MSDEQTQMGEGFWLKGEWIEEPTREQKFQRVYDTIKEGEHLIKGHFRTTCGKCLTGVMIDLLPGITWTKSGVDMMWPVFQGKEIENDFMHPTVTEYSPFLTYYEMTGDQFDKLVNANDAELPLSHDGQVAFAHYVLQKVCNVRIEP